RWLRRLSDVSYRNAMTTISARGWRRNEPGLVGTIEQPSLLPRAVELLSQEGIDEYALIAQCRVPVGLVHTVTARAPAHSRGTTSGDRPSGDRIVSLLERQPRSKV